MTEPGIIIEKLLSYAENFLSLNALDKIFYRNLLLKELKLSEPYFGEIDLDYIKELTVPDQIVDELCDYAEQAGIIKAHQREHYSAYIMGIITPRPSEVNTVFRQLKEDMNIDAACKYLYDLSIKNNYIQKTAIERNIKWDYKDGDNVLEITINLSKPEKDNREIAKLLKSAKKTNYPPCVLCKENEGFEGTLTHAPRVNLRTVSLKLGGEDWFVQYSPYLYYNEHCIAISKVHTPMKVDGSTLIKLLDFVDYFPNYFIGSNAALPIVGGSILNHEHFQGGRHLMPMHRAGICKHFTHPSYPLVETGIIDWYNSAIRLTSVSRRELAELGALIIDTWRDYSDADLGIISQTDGAPHNTVTPIVRLIDGKYCLEIIFRNNRTDQSHPGGIFHAHSQYHNIKKEGIGIIEAMGLLILPGRLKTQLGEMAKVLCAQDGYSIEDTEKADNLLFVHRHALKELWEKHGKIKDIAAADKVLRDYINQTCVKILGCTAVFKKDDAGNAGFSKFLSSVGLIKGE